jgi:hypothetical protein
VLAYIAEVERLAKPALVNLGYGSLLVSEGVRIDGNVRTTIGTLLIGRFPRSRFLRRKRLRRRSVPLAVALAAYRAMR